MGGESTPRLATTPRCRSVRLRISSVCHERGTMSKNPRYPAAAVPYLMIRGAAQGIDFYKKAFGAEETMRFPAPGGTIGHAEIRVEGAPVFLADEGPGVGLQSPQQLGGTPGGVWGYIEDVDALARRAEGAGAKELRAVADQFYGEWTQSRRA